VEGFILATNVLYSTQLSSDDAFREYKAQQGVEQVVNLTDERVHILQFFCDAIRRYYLLPAPDS
jgi:hypothetical protein